MTTEPRPFSEEFFYLDESGDMQDADLHEEILAGANPSPAIDVARECGLTDAEIASLYGEQE
jgi:hypothetical protein